jgi:nickel-dependent lactate racemase
MGGVIGGPDWSRATPVERLSSAEVRAICAAAMENLPLDGKRVLVLIPDRTRHAPIDLFFRILTDLLCKRVKQLDFLVAAGTHHPMSMQSLYAHVGMTAGEHRTRFPNVAFFNHKHDNKSELVSLGILQAKEISLLTDGLFAQDIPITINRKAVEYDHILIVSPVVPHEAMGFAGGNKYFFPGIGGVEIIETFHWLAAVITNPVVNGVKDTPTRRVIDQAASFLHTPATCLAFAIDDHHKIACLFAGDPIEAWSRAADCSAQLHITYLDKPIRRVVGITPEIYDDIWVAGKAMYKLEPVIADGGEVVIYGPHIKELSFTHGNDIRRIGYHVRDFFVKQWGHYAREPKLILAHSTNVKGIGTFDNGRETPRISVTLATSIPEDVCKQVNLGFQDPRSIDLDALRADEDDDVLVVEHAGQVLYRLRN